MDFHLHSIAKNVKLCIKDTNDFLKRLCSVKNLPYKILCLMDVVGLHPNIPHDEDLSALRTRHDEADKKNASTHTLVELAELVLKNNIFNFTGKTFEQIRGA